MNGLGYAASRARIISRGFETKFSWLEETPAIFLAWKSLVDVAGVIGKQVHDARLVAVCHAHGVDQLLTFNAAHFQRYATIAPGVGIMDPVAV
jgi:predicted nucleic acid-binding protein